MSGIAGIERAGARAEVEKMLSRIGHRGPAGREIIETGTATLGLVFSAAETQAVEDLRMRNILRDGEGYSRLAEARSAGDRLTLTRDAAGSRATLLRPAGRWCAVFRVRGQGAFGAHARGPRITTGLLLRRPASPRVLSTGATTAPPCIALAHGAGATSPLGCGGGTPHRQR